MLHRQIVILDELSRRRNGFRRNVMEAFATTGRYVSFATAFYSR